MKQSISFSMVAAVLVSACGAIVEAAPGEIINLGTPPGSTGGVGLGISNGGVATGSTNNGDVISPDDSRYYAYRWSPSGGMQSLGTLPGGGSSSGIAINASGQVAGFATIADTTAGDIHPVRWLENGQIQDLGTFGGTFGQAVGINASGHVVGMSMTASGDRRAFRWNGSGALVDMGTLGGTESWCTGINDLDQVVGSSSTATGYVRAFLWSPSTGMRNLGTLGGTESWATAISSNGWVAGESRLAAGPSNHAFRWSEDQGMVDLETLGGSSSSAYAINAAGVAVGYASLPGNADYHPALWKVDGSVVDLDAWLDATNPAQGAFWTLTEAKGINDQGLVVGTGIYDDGPGGLEDGQRPFVLDASSLVPEPGVAGIFVGGSLTLLSMRRRRPGAARSMTGRR